MIFSIMIKKQSVETIEVDFWFGDEVTVINGKEVMLVNDITFSQDRITYGCLKGDGSLSWYTKSQLKGFSEIKSVGFLRKND